MKEIINYLYAFQSSTSVIGNANLNRSFASLVTEIRDCVLKVIFSFQGLVVKNPLARAGDVRDAGSVPACGRSSREGNGNRLQYSCLENSMDKKSLAGYSPGGRKESDTTERLSTAPSTPCTKQQGYTSERYTGKNPCPH